MSISNKGFIAFLFLLILAVSFVTWLTYVNNERYQEAVLAVNHSSEVLHATEELMSTFKDVQVSSHNYLFTRRDVHIQRLDSAIARANAGLADLKNLVSQNEIQRGLADSLALYVQQRVEFSRKVVESVIKRDTIGAFNIVSSGRGIELTNKLAYVIGEMRQLEQSTLDERRRKAATTELEFNAVFRLTLLLIIAMTGITVAIAVYNSKLESKIRAQINLLDSLNQDLQRRERRFKGLVENGFEAISLLDQEMKPIYRSPAAEKITGWSNDERTQVTGIERAHPDDLERFRNIARYVLDNPGKLVEASIRTQHKNGHYIWLEGIMKNMLHDDALGGIVANFRDVTERKQIEMQRVLYESIIQYSEDAIIGKSITGAIITWNRAAETLFGYKVEEIVGKSFAVFTPEDLMDEEVAIIGKVQSGIPVENFETERLTKSGKRIHVSLTASPLYDQDGKMVGTSQIARDITQRKTAEEKIHRLNIELEHKVLVRTNELSQANKELKAVSHYIADGVHVPLEEIEKHIFFIQQRLRTKDADIAQSVNSISLGVNEALRLINELIQFSEITQRNVNKLYVDMNELMQQLQRGLSPEIRSAVEVSSSYLHPVVADPGLLKELFSRVLEVIETAHTGAERLKVKITSHIGNGHVVYSIDYGPLMISSSLFSSLIGAEQASNQTLDRGFVSLLVIRHIVAKHSGILLSEAANSTTSRIQLSIPINGF